MHGFIGVHAMHFLCKAYHFSLVSNPFSTAVTTTFGKVTAIYIFIVDKLVSVYELLKSSPVAITLSISLRKRFGIEGLQNRVFGGGLANLKLRRC